MPVAQKELVEAQTGGNAVASQILPGSHQVSSRLLLRSRDMDGGQLSGPQEAGELVGVAGIGLHAVSRFARDERRRDDGAVDAHRVQLPVDLEATGAGLVAAPQLPFSPKSLDRAANHLGVVGNLAPDPGFRCPFVPGDRDGPRMDIEP